MNQRSNCQHLLDHGERMRVPEKIIYFCSFDYAFDCVDQINDGRFWRRWAYETTWPASWEIHMQVRKQRLVLDIEQQTSSKEEKEYVKYVYGHPAYVCVCLWVEINTYTVYIYMLIWTYHGRHIILNIHICIYLCTAIPIHAYVYVDSLGI